MHLFQYKAFCSIIVSRLYLAMPLKKQNKSIEEVYFSYFESSVCVKLTPFCHLLLFIHSSRAHAYKETHAA